jgi:hypothetical protein
MDVEGLIAICVIGESTKHGCSNMYDRKVNRCRFHTLRLLA